jgi:N-acetylglucosamine malate deacetylase 1
VRAELRESCDILGVTDIMFEEIPAVMVSDQPPWKLNQVTGRIIRSVEPDILYVPFLNDLHKDHRECFHSFSVAWRPVTRTGKNIKEIYAYEVASETHLNFPYVEQGFFPNTWVDISDYLETKLQALACYKSQIKPHPSSRSLKAIEAQAIWRGAQIGVSAAEAFVLARKIV